MDRSIQAGISGTLLAIVINLFLPVSLGFFDFIPSFLAAIFIIYTFRLGALRDGLIVAFMTYIFNDGVLGTLTLAMLYVLNEPYELTVESWMIFSPIVTSITALIAGYIGVRLVQRIKPAHELPPSLPPPLPPV